MRIMQIIQKSDLSAKRSTSLHHCSIRRTLTPNFLGGGGFVFLFQAFLCKKISKKYFSANPWYRKFEEWPTIKDSKVYDGCSGTSVVAAAVTWLKYCRYGEQLYPINQSINQSIAVFVVSSEEVPELLAA